MKNNDNDYTAFTISFKKRNTTLEIKQMINYLSRLVGDEIHYSIEFKQKDLTPHVHGYTLVSEPKLKYHLKTVFLGYSWHTSKVFDLSNWIGYMSKDTHQVITSKSINYDGKNTILDGQNKGDRSTIINRKG